MSDHLNVLFVSDVVGDPGLSLLETLLPSIIKKYEADFVVVNGENSHEGKGINEAIIRQMYGLGAHVITGGNHTFDKWKIYPYMKTDRHLLRPLNYPKGAHGYGFGVYDVPGTGHKIGVLNLQGRTFMDAIDDPFRVGEWALEKIRQETNMVLIDFHAEATAEKMAFAWHVEDKASMMVGTHTHIPTNDARILPQGLGYITDAGMTGSFDSVLGMDKNTAIKRFLLSTPHRYKVANGDNRLCGVHGRLNTATGNCEHIQPIIYPSFQTEKQEL